MAFLLTSENTPWIDQWPGQSEQEGGLVQAFMKDTGCVSQRKDQVKLVLSFCPNETLQELESGSLVVHKSCLLDDRSNDGNKCTSRGYHGPLTERELQAHLKKDRFFPSSSGIGSEDVTTQATPHVNADRRLIYMTNLNRWGMMALITTASGTEAAPLRGAFFRHLSFESHIGVHCPSPKGYAFFELAFDFPFYVWTTTLPTNKPADVRLKHDGDPLRQVQDLSFLKQNELQVDCTAEVDYLCQAQVSVLISMIDDRRWVAYGFFDTYFESDPDIENVEVYDSDYQDGLHPDPFRMGLGDMNSPILDPWKYFWVVFEVRILQVKIAWQFLAQQLKERIETYIQTHPLGTIPLPGLVLKQSLDWICGTKLLLCTLTETLSSMIKEWKSFKPRGSFSMESVSRYHDLIQEAFRELGKCVDKLQSLRSLCVCYAENLALHMNGEGHRHTEIQVDTAQSTHIGTNYMIYCVFPMTLATGMLSMQENAIPTILGPTKVSFVILAAILMVLVYLSLELLSRWKYVRDFFNRRYGAFLLYRWGLLKRKIKRPKFIADEERGGNSS